jgi:hypothetical protein
MANNSYDQITIQGKNFRVPIRYAAGHTLKENEAGALNQTLHENLRNNFAKKVVEGVEAGLSDEVLQQQLDDYAADYQFGVRGGGGGYRGDPVKTLAMNMARDLIRQLLKKKGVDMDTWPAAKISTAAQSILESQGEDGTIMTHARKQVEAEKAAAEQALSDVDELVTQALSAPAE